MTPEQIKGVAQDAQVVGREVTVHTSVGETITGPVTYTGQRVFRVDTPLAVCFFAYREVEEISLNIDPSV